MLRMELRRYFHDILKTSPSVVIGNQDCLGSWRTPSMSNLVAQQRRIIVLHFNLFNADNGADWDFYFGRVPLGDIRCVIVRPPKDSCG
jgi:hypothetical protein